MNEKIKEIKDRIIDFLYCHFEVFCLCIIIIVFLSITYIFQYSNYNESVIEIKDKFIKNYDGNDTYIIVDSNNNSYRIKDLLFIWKFNSTDLYSSIEIGEKYRIQTTGIRFRLFSVYPNINNVEKIEE